LSEATGRNQENIRWQTERRRKIRSKDEKEDRRGGYNNMAKRTNKIFKNNVRNKEKYRAEKLAHKESKRRR